MPDKTTIEFTNANYSKPDLKYSDGDDIETVLNGVFECKYSDNKITLFNPVNYKIKELNNDHAGFKKIMELVKASKCNMDTDGGAKKRRTKKSKKSKRVRRRRTNKTRK